MLLLLQFLHVALMKKKDCFQAFDVLLCTTCVSFATFSLPQDWDPVPPSKLLSMAPPPSSTTGRRNALAAYWIDLILAVRDRELERWNRRNYEEEQEENSMRAQVEEEEEEEDEEDADLPNEEKRVEMSGETNDGEDDQ